MGVVPAAKPNVATQAGRGPPNQASQHRAHRALRVCSGRLGPLLWVRSPLLYVIVTYMAAATFGVHARLPAQ
jgi:hypothetical protein